MTIVRPSRRPLRGLLRMRKVENCSASATHHLPHPEGRPTGRVSKDAPPRCRRKMAFLYMLCCRDGSYYVGTTRGSLEQRIAQHEDGTFGGFTALRRPVRLVFHQEFERITGAIAAERQVKGWRREEKEALIAGAFD